MEKWSALIAIIVAVLAALPNILLYINDRKQKLNLALGVLSIMTGLGFAFYALFFYTPD